VPRHLHAPRWAAIALALASCTRPAVGPSAATVYGELVEGGCLAATPDGVQAVADEHADHATPWVECLFDGGPISACAVPCP
jgi:hypothetical protein